MLHTCILLTQTYKPDPANEELAWDIHFWIGKYSTQVSGSKIQANLWRERYIIDHKLIWLDTYISCGIKLRRRKKTMIWSGIQWTLSWKTTPSSRKMFFLKTGGLWWQGQLYWVLGLSGGKLLCFKTGGLLWHWIWDRLDCVKLCMLALIMVQRSWKTTRSTTCGWGIGVNCIDMDLSQVQKQV